MLFFQPLDQPFDRLGLITFGLELGDEFKTALIPDDYSKYPEIFQKRL